MDCNRGAELAERAKHPIVAIKRKPQTCRGFQTGDLRETPRARCPRPQYYPKAQIRQGADRSAEREGQSLPPAHRGARVIRTDALRFMPILQEPRGGQERKQDSEDDRDINAHQSNPAAALPTNSSLTDAIYFDDLVAQAPERKPVPSRPRHCRDVAHAQTGLA